MIAHDIPGLLGAWRFDQRHYKTGIWKDPLTGTLYNGFEDLSGYRNQFAVRSGTLAYETRVRREGLILDNTQLLTALCPIAYDGSLVAVFQDGCLLNTTHFLITFEDFDQTTTRVGTPNYYTARRDLGGGTSTIFAGQSSDITSGAGGAAGVTKVVAFAADQIRAQCTLRIDAGADIDNATSTIAATSPKGADMVLGRLNLQADASRTAVAGVERFWLQGLYCWAPNILKDHNALATAFMAQEAG